MLLPLQWWNRILLRILVRFISTSVYNIHIHTSSFYLMLTSGLCPKLSLDALCRLVEGRRWCGGGQTKSSHQIWVFLEHIFQAKPSEDLALKSGRRLWDDHQTLHWARLTSLTGSLNSSRNFSFAFRPFLALSGGESDRTSVFRAGSLAFFRGDVGTLILGITLPIYIARTKTSCSKIAS